MFWKEDVYETDKKACIEEESRAGSKRQKRNGNDEAIAESRPRFRQGGEVMAKRIGIFVLVGLLIFSGVSLQAFAADGDTVDTTHEYLVGEEFNLSAYPVGARVEGFDSSIAHAGEAQVKVGDTVTTVPYTVLKFEPKVENLKKGTPFRYSIVSTYHTGLQMAVTEGVDFFIYGDTDTLTVGTKQVTFEYKGRFFPVTYTVTDRELTAMAVVPGSFKARYYQGELVDVTSARVRLVWADGETTTYNVREEHISNFSTATTGLNEMTVTVLGKTVQVPYVVEVGILDVSVQYSSYQAEYKLNDAFKTFTVNILYTDLRSSSQQIDAGMVKGFDTKTLGNKTLTFTVGNVEKSMTYAVVPEIQSISVVTGTLPTKYDLDSFLQLSGAELRLSYKGGTYDIVPIYDYMVSGFDSSKEGKKQLTIKYETYQTTFQYEIVDFTKPTLELYYDEDYYSSDKVTVEVTASGYYKYIVLPNGSRTTNSTYTYTIRANGSYTFKLVPSDSKISTIEETLEIDMIDTEEPTIKVTLRDGKIYVSAEDKESGVYKITLQNGKTLYYSDLSEELAPNQNGTITATDNAGNQAQYSIYTYAGVTFAYPRYNPETVELMGSNIGDVTYREQKISLAGSYASQSVTLTESSPHTFSWNNYRYTLGGSGYTAANDITAPQIIFTQEGNAIRWTVTDASNITTVTINNSATTLRTGVFENTPGSTYTIYAKDASGNEASRVWKYGDTFGTNGDSNSGYVPPNLTNQFNVKVKTVTGYVNGYEGSLFKPDNPVTKAEIIQMLARVLDSGIASYSTLSSDTARTEWLTKAADNMEAYSKIDTAKAEVLAEWFAGDITRLTNRTFAPTIDGVTLPAASNTQNKATLIEQFNKIKEQWFFESWSTVGASGLLTEYYISKDVSKQSTYFEEQISAYASREWLAEILYTVVDTSIPAYNKTFSDTTNAKILAVANKGLLNGYPDGSFKPKSNITRAEVVTMMNHMLGQYLTGSTSTISFTDIGDHWAQAEITKAGM
jgi:hypothetical protein